MSLTQELAMGTNNKTFSVRGKKIAAARVAAGLSQADLARAIGRSLSAVTKIEGREIANIFNNKRNLLMDALKMSPERFDAEIVAPPREIDSDTPANPGSEPVARVMYSEESRRLSNIAGAIAVKMQAALAAGDVATAAKLNAEMLPIIQQLQAELKAHPPVPIAGTPGEDQGEDRGEGDSGGSLAKIGPKTPLPGTPAISPDAVRGKVPPLKRAARSGPKRDQR